MKIKMVKDLKAKNLKKDETYEVLNKFGKELITGGYAIDPKNPPKPKKKAE